LEILTNELIKGENLGQVVLDREMEGAGDIKVCCSLANAQNFLKYAEINSAC
jgi:hypothetical protein